MAMSFCSKRIILTRTRMFKTPNRKHGYIVLLPEIGEDLPEKNPLFKENGLPEFNTFTIERSIAAIGRQTVEYEQGIKNIEERLENGENLNIVNDLLHPLEDLYVPLEATWGVAKALYFGNQSMMPTRYYESVHNRMHKARSAKFTSVSIYKACKAALESKDTNWTNNQKKVIAQWALEGRLNGLELSKKEKGTFDFCARRLSEKRDEVRRKLRAASYLVCHTITNPNVVKDFPEEYLKIIALDPANPIKGPWKLNLQPHIITPFLELCPSRELRWNLWHSKVSLCSRADENRLSTSGPIGDIRDNLITQAKMLGYKSYSHLSMETKMARSLETVYDVLDNLLQYARPAQEEEFKELLKFARERGFEDTQLQAWDVDYWSRKHRRSVLNVKDEILKDYFPLPNVLKGLFELVETLFDVQIVETRKTDIWHADVRFFDLIDLKESSGEPVASFYLDPYARRDIGLRMEKDAGWMIAMRNRSDHASTKPLAALIFNFQQPTNDKPSLLSFKDVAVLFQKFGNALQHLLTKIEYAEISGRANVEWDATGISGDFLQNWLYEPSVIRQVSGHYNTSAPLPAELVDSLKNIRSHMAGYNLCKELYLSKLDLQLHELDDFWDPIMKRLWKEHFVYPLDYVNEHVCSWHSVFVGSWGGCFYSDLWSSMAAADVYGAFREIPANDENLKKETAMRFKETFLSLGGSCPASEVFRKFRGRDPCPKALLENLKLIKKPIERIE